MQALLSCGRVLLTAASALISCSALAWDDTSLGLYVQAGRSLNDVSATDSATVGVVVPWSHAPWTRRSVTFYWDFFASQWRAPAQSGAGRDSYTQAGVSANWRYRLADGASPWFAEVGLGGTLLDSLYRTPDRQFSTAFQFTEQIGAGRSFGPRGEHELSLRVQHFSNAGIKKPNPGATFARIRYLYRF